MNADVERIHTMVGELSEAFWDRITQPGVGTFDELDKAKRLGHVPRSEREIAVWDELTAPKNLPALRQYIGYWNSQAFGINGYAKKLHQTLLAHAEGRIEEGGQG